MLVKNRHFGQKSNVSTTNQKFGQQIEFLINKWNFWSKIEIFIEKLKDFFHKFPIYILFS